MESSIQSHMQVCLQDGDVPRLSLQDPEHEDDLGGFSKPGVKQSINEGIQTRVQQHDPRQDGITVRAYRALHTCKSGIEKRAEAH